MKTERPGWEKRAADRETGEGQQETKPEVDAGCREGEGRVRKSGMILFRADGLMG